MNLTFSKNGNGSTKAPVDELRTSETLYTTNFKMFKFHPLQRPLHNTKNVREELERYGQWQKIHPLLCNQHHQILDGQNRIAVAQELGFHGLYYVVIHTRDQSHDLQIMHSTNNVGRKWDTNDNLQQNIGRQLKSSILLGQFVDKYGFNISHSVIICTPPKKQENAIYNGIKNHYEFELHPKRDEIAEFILQFKELPFFNTVRFTRAIKKFWEKSNKAQKEKLLSRRVSLTVQANESGYCAMFVNFVNKGVKSENELVL